MPLFQQVAKFLGFTAEKKGLQALSQVPGEAAAFIKGLEKLEPTSNLPKFAYRSRDIGEMGIPFHPQSHAQATMSVAEAQHISPSRGLTTQKPQEIVRVNLAELPPSAYQVMPRKGKPSWVKFKREIYEDEVRRVELQTRMVKDRAVVETVMQLGQGHDNSSMLRRSLNSFHLGSRNMTRAL